MALATTTTPGSVILGGDLTGVANAPELRVTGVEASQYICPTIVVDAKGRLIYAAPYSNAGDAGGSFPNFTLDSTGVIGAAYTMPTLTITTKGLVTTAVNALPADIPTSITGDGNGLFATTTLSTTSVTPGTYNIATMTIDTKGRITSASTNSNVTFAGEVQGLSTNLSISPSGVAANTYTLPTVSITSRGLITSASSGVPSLSGDVSGPYNATVINALPVSPAGTYSYPSITVDAKGRITSATTNSAPSLPEATTSSKGVVQIGLYLSVDNGILSGTPATSGSPGFVTSANSAHISITAGGVNVGSAIPKLNTLATFTKALQEPVVVAPAVLTPDLNAGTLFELAGSSKLMTPINSTDGSVFEIVGTSGFTQPAIAINFSRFASNGSIFVGIVARVSGGTGTDVYYTSTNGLDWSAHTLPLSALWDDIVWTGSFFCITGVTYGTGLSIGSLISADGINWSGPSASHGLSLLSPATDLVFAGGLIFAVDTVFGAAATEYGISTDGLNWSLYSYPATSLGWKIPTYGNNKFLTVEGGSNGAGVHRVITSTDGINWTVQTLDTSNTVSYFLDVWYTPQSGFVLVGSKGVGQGQTTASDKCFMSATGSTGTWSSTSFPGWITASSWTGSRLIVFGHETIDWTIYYAPVYTDRKIYQLSGATITTLQPETFTSQPSSKYNSMQYADGFFNAPYFAEETNYLSFDSTYKISGTIPSGPFKLNCAQYGGNNYCTYSA